VDASHPAWEEHVAIGSDVLEEIGVASERVLVVLNKVDLLPPGQGVHLADGGRAVQVSAHTGAGLEELRREIRRGLLMMPGVTFLRVPLADPEAVQRAVTLPYQVAQRFVDEAVEVATRVDTKRLEATGLAVFRVPGWAPAAVAGGS
jgi:50S ribosomal subunit-associated GTPase HflX